MRVSECMSSAVHIAAPGDTIQQVAATMKVIDAGSLPIGENDRLVGMITDRDIVCRAVAEGLGAHTPVERIMSRDLLYCFEDEDVVDVIEQMSDHKVRRLPVINRDNRLVGIVSLGDLSKSDDDNSGEALSEITAPGGAHSQH